MSQSADTVYRTHRERKEIYIKALEEQVMTLKETYTGTVQERNAVAEENRRLKELLRLHGISDPSVDGHSTSGGPTSTYAGSVTDSRTGSYNYQAFSPPPTVISGFGSPAMRHISHGTIEASSPLEAQQQQQQVDHDQIGVNFVLASVNRQGQGNSRNFAPSSYAPSYMPHLPRA